MIARSLPTAALLALLPAAAGAQGDCFPPKDSNEAQTLAIFSVPLAFGRLGAPEASRAGAIRVGLEGSYLPAVDDETATPRVCRPGKGPENTDLLFAFPRPRLGIGLPGGFAFEASWVPPIRLSGVKANLFGLALERAFPVGRGQASLGVRAHATFGSIRAPVTCDDEALEDPLSECFNGTRSDDLYKPNIAGVDLTLGWSLAQGRWRPYLGAGYSRLQPRFQVNFTNQFGQLDNRKVEVDLDRAVLFAGATWMAGTRLGVAGEVYAAPADAVTGRLAIRAELGGGGPR